jgi:hypothetical protein
MSKLVRQRRSGSTTLGAVLCALALCLRLASPAPFSISAVGSGLAGAFPEHALCLATPPVTDKAPLSQDQKPGPGDHADHDGLGCCLWHGAVGFTLPRIAAVVPIAFVERPLPRTTLVKLTPPSRPIGPVQARAPPEAA